MQKDLLIYILRTIELHKDRQLTYDTLKSMTANELTDISSEQFDTHFFYLKEMGYISYHNTLKDGAHYIYDLGLTFYGRATLKQKDRDRKIK